MYSKLDEKGIAFSLTRSTKGSMQSSPFLVVGQPSIKYNLRGEKEKKLEEDEREMTLVMVELWSPTCTYI